MKVNHGETKVLVSAGITNDGISESKVDPSGVCSLRVKANSVLCLQCGKWIHSRCVGVKWVAQKQEVGGWVRSMECGELLYGRRFPLRLKLSAYGSYGSETWCIKESEIGKICGESNVFTTAQR